MSASFGITRDPPVAPVQDNPAPNDRSTQASPILQVPSITLSPRSDSGVSLGTRIILSPSSPSSTMAIFNFGSGARSPASASADPVTPLNPEPIKAPGQVAHAVAVDPTPAAVSTPHSLPRINLDTSALPVGEKPKAKPHARRRLKAGVRKRSQSIITKARRLVMKKKILALLFGRDMMQMIHPHIETATRGAAQAAG